MITKKKLLRTEQQCYDYSNGLKCELEKLARMASEVLGFKVIADICNGEEIEFRAIMSNDVANVDIAIRMEDIIKILQ